MYECIYLCSIYLYMINSAFNKHLILSAWRLSTRHSLAFLIPEARKEKQLGRRAVLFGGNGTTDSKSERHASFWPSFLFRSPAPFTKWSVSFLPRDYWTLYSGVLLSWRIHSWNLFMCVVSILNSFVVSLKQLWNFVIMLIWK